MRWCNGCALASCSCCLIWKRICRGLTIPQASFCGENRAWVGTHWFGVCWSRHLQELLEERTTKSQVFSCLGQFHQCSLTHGDAIQEAQRSKYQADRCMRDQLEKQHRAAFACNVSCCVRRTQAHLPLCSACAFACESDDYFLALAAIVSTQHRSMHFVDKASCRAFVLQY